MSSSRADAWWREAQMCGAFRDGRRGTVLGCGSLPARRDRQSAATRTAEAMDSEAR